MADTPPMGAAPLVLCDAPWHPGEGSNCATRAPAGHIPAEVVATLAGYLRRRVQPGGKRQSSQDDPTDGPKLDASRAQRHGVRLPIVVARRYLEPYLEPVFHTDSYGYRPSRSAIDAVRQPNGA
jgi:hypothetical protein